MTDMEKLKELEMLHPYGYDSVDALIRTTRNVNDQDKECTKCNGTGRSIFESECEACDGSGVVEPMTNEEWLRSCSTEELAELLFHIFGQGVLFGETHESVPMFPDDEVITESVFDCWLQEKHH